MGIDCDVNPSYVRCTIKGKLTQLKLGEEVLVSKSTVQRSKTTGKLRIHMPLANPRDKSWLNKDPVEEELKPLEPEPEKAVSLSIVGGGKATDIGLKEAKVQPKPQPKEEEEFIDDPDVPPLEYAR